MRIEPYLSLVLAFAFCPGPLLAQAPADQPNPAEPVSVPAPANPNADRDLQLKALLDLYVKDQITAGDYQRRRAQILGRSRPPTDDPWDRASVRSSNTGKPAAPPPKAAAFVPPTEVAPSANQSPSVLKLAGSTAPAIASAVSGSSPILDAAIVPGADLYVQVDFQSVRQAPIYPVIEKFLKQKPAQDSSGPAAQVMKNKEMFDLLEQNLGLKEGDIERIVFSADLDNVKMGAGQTSMESVPGVAAVQLAKEVTTAQMKEAILASSKDNPPTLTEAKIGPADVLIVKSKDEKDPQIHLTVVGGKTILAGLNQTSLSSALTRASGAPAQLSGVMAANQRSIPPGSQIKLGLVVPQSFKDMFKGLTDPGANSGAGAPGGGGGPEAMLGGLKDLKSISLGIALAEGANIRLSGDMGQPQAADGVNMLVQMMKPQLISSLAQQMGKDPKGLPANLINSKTADSKVDISFVLNKEVIEALAKE